MHDEAAFWAQVTQRMQTLYIVVRGAESIEGGFPHTGHDPHVDDHVWTVGDFHANLAVWRTDRPHDVGHYVESAVFHRPGEERADFLFRFRRRHPVVVGPGVFLVTRTDEGQVFGTSNVTGVAAVKIAARVLSLIQFKQCTSGKHLLDQTLVL